jgi:hypothetical protein
MMSDESEDGDGEHRATGFILQASSASPGGQSGRPARPQKWDPCVLNLRGNRLEVFLSRSATVSSRDETPCCAMDVCASAAYSPPASAALPLDPTLDGATYFSCSGVVAGPSPPVYETIVCCALDAGGQW